MRILSAQSSPYAQKHEAKVKEQQALIAALQGQVMQAVRTSRTSAAVQDEKDL